MILRLINVIAHAKCNLKTKHVHWESDATKTKKLQGLRYWTIVQKVTGSNPMINKLGP